jgi:hypothetical protein
MRGEVRLVFTRNSGVGEPLNPFLGVMFMLTLQLQYAYRTASIGM